METESGTNTEESRELERLKQELEEANMTLEAIRTGQVDALLVESESGPQLFTLNSADQTYRFFIEQMKEGAVTLDQNGLILFSNSQFANLAALPVSDLAGRKMAEIVCPDELKKFQAFLELAWEQPQKEEFNLLREGKLLPVQFSVTALQLDDDISLSVLVTDLTDQKATENMLKENNERLLRMNRALEASNHDLQQFASVASHDLQEPVRKIQIFSNMIREQEKHLSETGLTFLNKVISSAERMKMLIVDILNYSGLSSNETNFQHVSLGSIVELLLEDFELIIESKMAIIRVGELPRIFGNAGQIRQVFQNLISNALKFVREGVRPEIDIESHRIRSLSFNAPADASGAFWLISVSDNGIGFDEIYADNIFSLFERLNGKDKFEGTGIGLAIAKKIVQKHGGLIRARSLPGSGSTFSLIIPAGAL